eukprot:TRINITY_DN54547_c0_g1_i1.p1 TRINITY_DN54547_c0_g1~~TRINITY_DN54547_c0_g1_i1.p1  ORF type:complete len:350 (-),score=72.57 TRINITY_DN54547_c0_g1_i1:200-1177(-)
MAAPWTQAHTVAYGGHSFAPAPAPVLTAAPTVWPAGAVPAASSVQQRPMMMPAYAHAVAPQSQAARLPMVQPMMPAQYAQRAAPVPVPQVASAFPAALAAPTLTTQATPSAATPSADLNRYLQGPMSDMLVAYGKLLQLLHSDGFFSDLQADGQGDLRIAVPFCGSCSEIPLLAQFVQQNVLQGRTDVRRVVLHCTDVEMQGAEYAKSQITDPRFVVELRISDLSKEQLPPASCVIGLHPQPIGVGGRAHTEMWERIIANVLASSPRCVFTTWMNIERDEILRMCKMNGRPATSRRNPAPLVEIAGTRAADENTSQRFHWIIEAR